jgi:hypothetical protein
MDNAEPVRWATADDLLRRKRATSPEVDRDSGPKWTPEALLQLARSAGIRRGRELTVMCTRNDHPREAVGTVYERFNWEGRQLEMGYDGCRLAEIDRNGKVLDTRGDFQSVKFKCGRCRFDLSAATDAIGSVAFQAMSAGFETVELEALNRLYQRLVLERRQSGALQ